MSLLKKIILKNSSTFSSNYNYYDTIMHLKGSNLFSPNAHNLIQHCMTYTHIVYNRGETHKRLGMLTLECTERSELDIRRPLSYTLILLTITRNMQATR